MKTENEFNETYLSLPSYLKKYCVEQDYDAYTTRDHAAWRYIMRQNRHFFSQHAVSVYEEGLRLTGIPIDRIPRVTEMDRCLRQFGWGAVPVCGFIPSAAFLEFQSLGVLAIATDMRTVEHIEYTPAPDIVHEAAGHAPIIVDRDYSEYLKRYAQVAHRSIISKEDVNVYEAIRYLSDIKENPDTKAGEIEKAEQAFLDAQEAVTHVSEAARVGRMAWWTVEYGLVGSEKEHKIYGAGLLSSVGESQNCLSSAVKKIPLSIACTETSFDITKPQPQLFVAKNMQHLIDVLDELESKMSFHHGGKAGLEKHKISQLVNTVVLNSGVQISGVLENYEADADRIDFIKITGRCQLAYCDQQLPGHGCDHHHAGFSSPIGRWKEFPDKPPHKITDDEMRSLGFRRGTKAKLEFANGFQVEGLLAGWHRKGEKLLYMTWRQCTVSRGDKIYFQPEWGDFDMVVGDTVVSVFGGPAAWDEYGDLEVGNASSVPGRKSAFTSEEIAMFDLYAEIREVRKNSGRLPNTELLAQIEKIATAVLAEFKKEWLLTLELFEICCEQEVTLGPKMQELKEKVLDQADDKPDVVSGLIKKGVSII